MIIFWPSKTSSPIYETDYSYRFCYQTTKELTKSNLIYYDETTSIKTALASIKHDSAICIVKDPETIITRPAIKLMEDIALKTNGAVGPIFNISNILRQVAQLPYPYVDKFSLIEVAEILKHNKGTKHNPTSKLDPTLITIPANILENTPLSMPLKNINISSIPKYISTGALVHKFANYYSAERSDLVELVPSNIKNVLDIGCAQGGYGKSLKQKRPEIHITGLELDSYLAKEAKKVYDKIILKPLEQASFNKKFDLINMGDVLEHLYDPWKMLKKIAKLLKPNGWLIGSVPNNGHWSIVKQLAQGDFEYIPVGLLCISHIRFFTESTLINSLKDAGFQIDYLERQQPTPTPKGKKFIEQLLKNNLGNKESLLTAELIFRAKLSQ